MMPILRRNNESWLPGIFNDIFSDDDWMIKANASAPAVNVIENAKDYKIEVAAPGMTKEDFKVNIDENDNLVISMEKKNENNQGKENSHYLRREFSYSKFQQVMTLPDNADKEKISAKVNNGILNIQIPKLQEDQIKKQQKLINVE
ncbi:MAG: Hsp20/alpha crystallin family protein [Bacteroidales bacterium]|jgi:Molecular chaperone (small heat shock protein)|nr:Hsp20/alpha crystallin family protein [Bacteroidales bacterium]MDD3911530.1 Hsp20/alpha crystallin family protein [Bacteroidales bacterium]MDD4420764.1 Hsp20/alpha crystallin family protein [Bacteroidales bacterium]